MSTLLLSKVIIDKELIIYNVYTYLWLKVWLMKAMTALFLDRDGVINIGAAPGEYITSIKEFYFVPGILNLISLLSKKQIPIFVITNQQCIGKGIVSMHNVDSIHHYMIEEIQKIGGNIEKMR